MYQFSYAEVLDETPKGARERERQAIDRSIELLREAEKAGVDSREFDRGGALSAAVVGLADRGPGET